MHRDFGSSGTLVRTPAAIDIRRNLPPSLSTRNVLVSITATTDHEVRDAGSWTYFIKLNGAPPSYTECTKFEVQSDGVPIWRGKVPPLTAQRSTFDISPTINQLRGTHPLIIKLDCYFQQREFPVVTVQIKPPNGEWRQPMAGDFTTIEPQSPNRPPNEQ